MDANFLSESDVCKKFITPALRSISLDEQIQTREEVCFAKCRIFGRGKLVSRGKGKRADYILPLNEQLRIAAKFELEANLISTTSTRSRLLEAFLHKALEPSAIPVLGAAE